MSNGTVKFFNAAKGFGFITSDEGGAEIFLPAAALASACISKLKTGQRVAFEAKPDSKGPKAINIRLLPDSTPQTSQQGSPPGKARLTFYHDPSLEQSRAALQELIDSGYEPHVIEYLVTPPDKDELKKLSLLFRGEDQSLVKRYDHLFLALSLDDRFISENEFWQAISEHPSLMNGPVLASATKAAICKSKNAVKAFFASASSATAPTVPRHKALPAGIQRMLGAPAKPAETAKDAPQDRPQSAITEKAAANSSKRKALAQPKQKPKNKKKVVTLRSRKISPTTIKTKTKARRGVAAKKSATRGRKKK